MASRRVSTQQANGPALRAEGFAEFDRVSRSEYAWGVTYAEAKRWLKKQGCRFEEGARHTFVYFGPKRSTLPRHPSKELNPRTWQAILRDLGLKG